MAEDRRKIFDAKTRKIAQTRPTPGKEGAAYQSAEKQLLAIQAEQQRNLEMARLSARSDAQQTNTLMQAAQVAAESANDGASEAVAQPVNPATQAMLSKYGMGQPRFIKKQSSSQQVTRGNVVINNNTTNQTTNNVAVPPNIGGPLQGRPIQFGPNAAANSGGKFKLWLSQTLANQKEEAAKRDREWERRDSSLAKSANKMMRKLEEIGRTMSEKLDPRRIGTTISSQLKSLLFIFGATFLATNWKTVLSTVDKIEHGIRDFGHWLGFGNQNNNEESGLVKNLKYLFGGEKNDRRNLGQIIFDIFYTKEGATRKGIINILMDYFDALIEDRKEALRSVTSKPIDIGAFGGVLEGLGLDKGFAALGDRLGDILTALVSGTAGLKNVLAKTYNNELKIKSTETNARTIVDENKHYFNTLDVKEGSAFYDKTNKTLAGDVTNNSTLHSFDFDSSGNLKQTVSAAKHQGDAIAGYLNRHVDKFSGKVSVNADQIIAGLARTQTYLNSADRYQDYRRYIIWKPEVLDSIRKHFGISASDSEWKAILSEASKHGQYKYIRRKLTPEERELADKYGEGNKEYIFEAVNFLDKRAGVKDSNGDIISGKGYGLDRILFDRLRHLIEKYTGYKGDQESDELKFDLSDVRSVEAIKNTLTHNKQSLLADQKYHSGDYNKLNLTDAEAKKRAWQWAGKAIIKDEKLDSYIDDLNAAEASHQRIEDANRQLMTDVGEANATIAAKHTGEYIDRATNAVADKIEETTGINVDIVRTNVEGAVDNFQTTMTTPKDENQWVDKYNSLGDGSIALIGDSYAVGMVKYGDFKSIIKQHGGNADKITTTSDQKDHSKYCVDGATISNAAIQVQSALRDGASVIIFHVGINDWWDTNNNSIRNKLIHLIEASRYKDNNNPNGRKGQARLYFVCPIIGQPRIGNGGLVLGEQVRRINTVIRSVCSSRGIGCLDLEPTSGKYTKWDREKIHPANPGAYKTMAADLVSLMVGKKVPMVPVVNPGQDVQGAGINGQVGSATGSQEKIIAYAVDHFVKKGYTPEQAAGIVGNLIREGLLTKNYGSEYADGSGPSAGIAGFHSYYNGSKGELDRLKEFARQRGRNWAELGVQLDYLTEGSADAQNALGRIKKVDNVSDSAKIWGRYYERFKGHEDYNNQNYKNRINSGNDALSIYNKNSSNISNMSSSTGISGGSYKAGNYSDSSSSSSSGGLFSSFLGNNSWLGALMETIGEMATHIWDYITPAITDTISENSDESDYEAYKLNPGELREGMTFEEWKAEKEKTNKMTPDELKAYTENQEPGDYTVNAEGVGKTADWMEAVITGNTNLIGKKPAEQTVELLAEIKELLEGHGKELKTGNEFAKIGIQATAQGFDQLSGLQLDNNQIVASNNSRKTPTSRPNDSGVNSQSIENFSAT